MYKIRVRNSAIIVYNYKKGDCPQLENYFTLYDRINHESYYKAIEFIKDKDIMILPRGLDIPFIESLLDCDAELDTQCDKFDTMGEAMIRYLPRDDRQKIALRFMLGKGEFKDNEYKSQFSVNLPTGSGKTYVSIMTATYLNIKSIVIAPNIGWLKQWKKCILEYTNIKSDEIYFLQGRMSINNILRDKKLRDKVKIILSSHSTLKSYGDKVGWENIGVLFKTLKIGLKFYDEAHLNFDNMCKIDFYTNTYKTFYVTATLGRSDLSEDRIYKLCFKNIRGINLFNEREDPHTKYISFLYNSHPTPLQLSRCKNMYGLNKNAYANYVVQKENFYNILLILIDIVLKQKGKALFFVSTNDAIQIVKEWLIDQFPELENHIGVYTSIIKENKKQQLDKKIIISTIKSSGTAVDIKDLKFTVCLAEPFKSTIMAKQTLGRTRDDNTYYNDVVDIGFYSINKWYHLKKNTFSKYALSTNEINLTDDTIEKKAGEVLIKLQKARKLSQYKPLFIRRENPLPLFRHNVEYKEIEPKPLFIHHDIFKNCNYIL